MVCKLCYGLYLAVIHTIFFAGFPKLLTVVLVCLLCFCFLFMEKKISEICIWVGLQVMCN